MFWIAACSIPQLEDVDRGERFDARCDKDAIAACMRPGRVASFYASIFCLFTFTIDLFLSVSSPQSSFVYLVSKVSLL